MLIFKKHISWKNGKYIDLWTINHILAGMLLGYVSFFSNLSVALGIAIALFLMIGWEIIERVVFHIMETWQNIILDVFVGLLGFVLVLAFVFYQNIDTQVATFIFLFVAWLVMNLIGFIAHKLQN